MCVSGKFTLQLSLICKVGWLQWDPYRTRVSDLSGAGMREATCDRASCSLGWPQTCYTAETTPQTPDLLPVPLKCWDSRCARSCFNGIYGCHFQLWDQVSNSDPDLLETQRGWIPWLCPSYGGRPSTGILSDTSPVSF